LKRDRATGLGVIRPFDVENVIFDINFHQHATVLFDDILYDCNYLIVRKLAHGKAVPFLELADVTTPRTRFFFAALPTGL